MNPNQFSPPQFSQPPAQPAGQQPPSQPAASPGASLMAMAQGGMQPQFAPAPMPMAQQPVAAPQQPAQYVAPQGYQPVQPTYVPQYTPPTNLPPQVPQLSPGVMNPMPAPQSFAPNGQATIAGLPPYVPPYPVASQQAAQQQPVQQPPVAPQQFAPPQWVAQQMPSAGPQPLVGGLASPASGPALPGQVPAQQQPGMQPVPQGQWPFVPPNLAATQQPGPQIATPRDIEMQRLNNELMALRLQSQSQQQPGQQSQQPQQPAAPQQPAQPQPRFNLDQWPDANFMFAEWRETRVGQDGRPVTGWKPDTPMNIRAAGDQYLQHMASWEHALLWEPHKVLPQMIEQYAARVAEKLVNDRVSASENTTRVDMMLANNDWLFGTDPASGQMVLNEYGRKMVALADYKPGQAPTESDVRNLETALQQVRLERERDDLRRQLQATQLGVLPQNLTPQQLYPSQPQPQLQFNPQFGQQPNGLLPGAQPAYPLAQGYQQQPGIAGLPQYQHPMAPQPLQQLGPQANQQLNQRLSQLDRMAQNSAANRTGSFPQPNVMVPSQQPQQNGNMTAGQKLIQSMRFGTAAAA